MSKYDKIFTIFVLPIFLKMLWNCATFLSSRLQAFTIGVSQYFHSTTKKVNIIILFLLKAARNRRKRLKGSLTRDFRLQVFFINQCPPGALSIPLRLLRIFSKIRGDIRVRLPLMLGNAQLNICTIAERNIIVDVEFFLFLPVVDEPLCKITSLISDPKQI
jgi:hypothetical protein